MMKAKSKFWKKALASFAVGGVIVSGLAIGGTSFMGSNPIITDASAGVSGGGSGSSGGGGGGGGAYWIEIPKAKLDNGSIRNIPSQYWNDPVCRNAIKYYGLVPAGVPVSGATSGSWYYYFYGVAGMGTVGHSNGSTVAWEIANNTGNGYDWSANYMREKNFICLDNPNVLNDSEWRYEVRSNSSSDSINETGIHSLTTTVKPQPIDGKLDPIGAVNLNEQTSTILTNFGRVWEEYRAAINAPGANTQNIVAQFKSRFAQAKTMDNSAARPEVNLNEDNQAGMAEGGILNVSENALNATANVSTSTTNAQVWRCGYVHYSRTGWQPSSTNNCGPVSGTINPDALPAAGLNRGVWLGGHRALYTPTTAGATSWERFSSNATQTTPTQQQLGFWQIISAHCNEPGIAALRTAMGADLVPLDSGDSSNEVSSLLRTKYYSQQPAVLPLGDRNAPNAAREATAHLSFYDKECPFDCTPNRNGAGASTANGASSNISQDNFEQTARGLYGVKSSDNVNSNYTELFRDNTERTIRPDVWYPVSGQKGVSYGGEAPKSVLVTRWSGGTPTLGTEFNAYAGKGDQKINLFDPKATKQANQKNFDVAADFKSSTAGQVAVNAEHPFSMLQEFTVQSTWASSDGKPQALQVAWEYAPSVTSRVPTGIRFAVGGANAQIDGFVDRSTQIDGRCWGEYGTPDQTTRSLAKSELRSNTGTGVSTNFTVPNGSDTTARNLVINFIRGTAE